MTAAASPISARRHVIGELGGDKSDPTPEDDGSGIFGGLNIYLDNNDLVIESETDLMLPMFDTAGRFVRTLTVPAGINRYTNISTGIYIVNGFKFLIK